ETHLGLCVACRLNRTIPDLSIPENSKLWGRIEAAKRRVISTLLTLNMPVRSKTEDPERGLAFDFLHSPEGGPPVTTGHANGLITLNIEEACSSVRERIREELNEPYRTLLGHFRHEIGHYYWDRLIQGSAWIDEFRKLFGDERADYAESLKRHYAQGPPVNWEATFISSYASSHPWEDWAETWAHMLHMADTLDTARSFGLDPQNLDLEIEPFTREALDKADDPEAGNFLTFLNAWVALSAVMNEMSRAMGQADFYPFALPRAATAKLQFLSIVVRAERDQLGAEAAAAD
ncbi:MAG: putative zinc-binding metallopeptidase, partial [Acidobacteriia bacterium]|nr:putative zinc-binding metallopeptidase [Terriglobia bacterium]